MIDFWEYLLFIGIIVCLWGAWRLRLKSLDNGRRWTDGHYRKASWTLLGVAAAGTLTLLITQ